MRVALAALCLVIVVSGSSAPVASAATCPNPREPNADFLCPRGPPYLIPGLTDIAGWDDRSHFRNILYGDILGGGTDEMVARGVGGIEVYRFLPATRQWSQIAVPPILPDREGWDSPLYFNTMDLGDIDGNGKDELVIRGKQGVVVFRFDPGSSPLSGQWRQITTSGPFPDSGWREPKYYTTIGLTPVGRAGEKRTMQLAARGQKGYGLWRWTGDGWSPLKGITALSDEAGFDEERYYSTISAWDGERLLARGPKGMLVFRYLPKENDWRQESAAGPCAVTAGVEGFPCDGDTIQLAHGVRGARDDPVVLARDARNGYGLQLARFELSTQTWYSTGLDRNPWHEAKYDKPEYRETIQAADVDGDGRDEVLGRADGGLAVFKLEFFDVGLPRWGNVQSFGRPNLADDPWGERPYYETITTARLRPDSRSRSLVARGPTGVRTWHWKDSTSGFGRPRPYGDFPEIEPRLLERMSDFLGIGRGTVRDVYTQRTRDPTADRLAGLQDTLAATCARLESGSPPEYERCQAPASVGGVSDTDWKEAANTIVAELYWARQVVDHFDKLNQIQTELFIDENNQFPSIVADLRIGTARDDARVEIDVMGLISTIAELVIGAEIPYVSKPVAAIGAAISIAAALTPQATGESPSNLEVSAADLQRTIAKLQQEIRDSITRQRRYVMGDPGLLGTVGRLVAGEVWELDRQAALSAGREGYTRTIYHALLPALWDRWEVERCVRNPPSKSCYAPESGPLLDWWRRPNQANRSVNFRGLVPKQTPCERNPFLDFSDQRTCTFKSLEDAGYRDTIKTLLTPIPASCRYDPDAGTSWQYGCPIGARAENLISPPERSPWQRFRARSCDYLKPGSVTQACHLAQE